MSTPRSPQVPFGAPMRSAHWAFSPSYLPLNHGSFGAHPTPVRDANLALRAEVDAAPDPFIAFEFAARLRRQRALTAKLLNAGTDEIVFVPNATTGIDTVFKNLRWEEGDVVVHYEVLYGAVHMQLSWLREERGVEVEVVGCEWPAADGEVVRRFVEAVRRVNREGGGKRRVRMAICDTVVSTPGFRVPFEELVPALKKEGVLVLLDAAHGIGHVEVDLGKLQPDFAVTNLHKWLYVPRGCAAFYVRKDNQKLIRTSLPTSIGFKPLPVEGQKELVNPLAPSSSEPFPELFDFSGTVDNTNFLCVEAALKFRDEVCGGEEAIWTYCTSMALKAGDMVAEMFGTEVLDYPGSCMRQCHFANVRLPLEVGDGPGQVKPDTASIVVGWLKVVSSKECGIYFQTVAYRGSWWWRISSQIYLEMDDYRKGAKILLELCERIKKGEHANAKPLLYHAPPDDVE